MIEASKEVKSPRPLHFIQMRESRGKGKYSLDYNLRFKHVCYPEDINLLTISKSS